LGPFLFRKGNQAAAGHQLGYNTAELQRRLADRLPGPELAEKAYGPMEVE